jgi:hypothetical protein
MPSQGGVPPSGRNHLHRVKPVARTEAMIDRQEARGPEAGARPPTRHLGVARWSGVPIRVEVGARWQRPARQDDHRPRCERC